MKLDNKLIESDGSLNPNFNSQYLNGIKIKPLIDDKLLMYNESEQSIESSDLSIVQTVIPDDKVGFDLYIERESGTSSHIPTGVLKCTPGYCGVNRIVVRSEETQTIYPPDLLEPNYWYLIFMDYLGHFHFQITDSTTANVCPEAELNAKAPVNSLYLARYQSGNPDRRLIGCVRAKSSTEWYDEYFNFPEPTWGTGNLGDVELDGSELGATGTPLLGIDECNEYHFNNLTITGTCYCGNSNGTSCKPTVIRVSGTLTIGASGQLNGTARGANGGVGGVGGSYSASGISMIGGKGGAGAKSGRPIYLYANRIINHRSSGYWITSRGGDANNGSNGVTSGQHAFAGGAAGGSPGQAPAVTHDMNILNKLIIITNFPSRRAI